MTEASEEARQLLLHPHCLAFFVDETGHEDFADSQYPVFGLGGCAIMVGAIDDVIRKLWRTLKENHFGGAEKPLHASELRDPSVEQLRGLAEFFQTQRFGRFAVTMNRDTQLPRGLTAYEVMAPTLRKRFEVIACRCVPDPAEVAFIHEASQRGDPLLEQYFGPAVVTANGLAIPAHHAVMPNGDECLEVADFIVHAAGGQARHPAGSARRRDFAAVFNSELLTSFIHIDKVES